MSCHEILQTNVVGVYASADSASRSECSSEFLLSFCERLARTKLRSRFAEIGVLVLGGSPGEFAKMIANKTEKWGKVVRFCEATVE